MMLSLLWAKAAKYVIALGVLLAAVAAIFLKGRSSGKAANQAQVEAVTVKADVAAADTAQVESRDATDQAVNALPEAPAQSVATADPATAAGKLASGGWVDP